MSQPEQIHEGEDDLREGTPETDVLGIDEGGSLEDDEQLKRAFANFNWNALD